MMLDLRDQSFNKNLLFKHLRIKSGDNYLSTRLVQLLPICSLAGHFRIFVQCPINLYLCLGVPLLPTDKYCLARKGSKGVNTKAELTVGPWNCFFLGFA